MKTLKFLILMILYTGAVYPEPQNYQKIIKLKETIEGEKLYSQGKYDEAIEAFKDAIAKGETRGEPEFYLGSIYENRHKYEESIPFFEEAVKKELSSDFREATLWKLIILHRKEQNYSEMLNYIDLLEEMGVSHPNLNKFREEADVSLSPEKVEARVILKENKIVIADWKKEYPEEDFWGENGAGELRLKVLESYEKAISLDDSLFDLSWNIAEHYEKMLMFKKATEIYDTIIARNHDGEAYYKNGIIARRTGNFLAARDYFFGALENLQKEEIRYFLLINLAQVLYALGDYENGIKYSREALNQDRKRSSDKIALDEVLYCLHLSLKKDISELKSQCQKTLNRNRILKNDVRIISLYYFTQAEAERALEEENIKTNEKIRKEIIQNYNRALVPPNLRTLPVNSLVIKERPDMYDDSDWVSLPNWALNQVENLLPFLEKAEAYREMFFILPLYKSYFTGTDLKSYNHYLSVSAYNLGENAKAVAALLAIPDRNVDEEILLLRAYLKEQEWKKFQDEFLSFIRSNRELKPELVSFLQNEADVKSMPSSVVLPEMKSFIGVSSRDHKEKPEPVSPENSPEQSTEPSEQPVENPEADLKN